MPETISCDVAIVGGGLSGGLIALALAARRPGVRVVIVDRGPTLGGNHIWSFFGSDIARADRDLVHPLVAHVWRDYDVAFPARRRTLPATYYSVTSERLDAAVRAALPPEAILTRRKVLAISATAVVLADGDRIEAGGVIDCRGAADLSTLDIGWQKFLGRELLLKRPHGVERPVVMDATVDQIDGYRFVYTLPFADDRMFVEDTYYSDTPDIDHARLAARIDTYAAAKGWKQKAVVREEAGALPVVIGGDFDRYWASGGKGVAKAGVRAGLFHPTTGYSLPDAVRTAALVAASRDLSGATLDALLHDYARKAWVARGFYRMLDAMLFRGAEPGERYRVLERFYGLDAGLVARFYAARSTLADKARVLIGRPPIPIGRATRAIMGKRV
ncbi:lycopene beta-cyclase CrtY [Sphingomonas donggukensis]|uniref:Lycopene beta-cyclase CrtY n=1 Tax=Sphingomonas donggukensis TaxID=2949093 RepID=A0ABY4TUA4_9SPHN|nr:lycopene beta-cyclase CrtY [Sphingomonas donggukensis]URW75430.1 lycopene beta-cyclase CrtY [Sphingomonas donggukensis]